MVNFFLGFALCAVLAFLRDREQQKRHDRLYSDFLKLVNEMSVRSGGRAIFKEKKPVVAASEPTLERGEFRLITPSMAEAEAMERDEEDGGSNVSDVDMEHLRREGLIQ